MMEKDSDRIFQIVKRNVDLWNPESLLPHAPDDEYDIESKKIAKQLRGYQTVEELGEIISRVFEEEFGEEYDMKRCRGVAEGIYRDWHGE